MKAVTEKEKKAKPDIRKVATRKASFISDDEFRKMAGIWKNKSITLEEIRNGVWVKK